MCESQDYQYFPSQMIGGGVGDYLVRVPVSSSKEVEFAVLAITNTQGKTMTIQVSGVGPPKTLDGTQNSSYNDTSFVPSMVFSTQANTASTLPTPVYDRVTNADGIVYVRVDGAGGSCAYVTIKFRVKILRVIPAPFTTVHPDAMAAMHKEREMRIQQSVLQTEGELVTYGKQPGPAGTIIKPDDFTGDSATGLRSGVSQYQRNKQRERATAQT